jgi:beta-lactamase superfamily II metal-dependent hydrolase
MLIDCGVILGTADATNVMQQVVADIAKSTDGRLDVVVATHQHWDHLSGFIQAQQLFDAIEIGAIWLAWTEDPQDHLASSIRAERARRLAALRVAVQRMQAAGAEFDQSLGLSQIGSLLDFFGDPAAAGRADTESALKYLKGRTDASIRYLTPGELPITLSGVDGIRIFVLGPPRDEKLLKMSDPTKRGREVYDKAVALTATGSFVAALAGAGIEVSPDEQTLSFPFDRFYQVLPDDAKKLAFFQESYGFDSKPESGPEWRRIESDWLSIAGELALDLDSDTNNTSLALAVELPGGRVLLFPADAQVGNWLSWGNVSWPGDHGAEHVTSADLLHRTVLYKVGHHGSHNATLRDRGLELMDDPALVAMIPVNREMALKKRWNMPFQPLLDRLKQRTRGRVLRVDEELSADPPEGLSATDWKAFRSRVTETRLYVDYQVAD